MISDSDNGINLSLNIYVYIYILFYLSTSNVMNIVYINPFDKYCYTKEPHASECVHSSGAPVPFFF